MEIKTKFDIGDRIELVAYENEMATITGMNVQIYEQAAITVIYRYTDSAGYSGSFELMENGSGEAVPVIYANRFSR